ncbi:MAG: hypothetical protein LBR46_07300 [Prevotella sp.]|jgi:hypothetical protein|nr:hypothetical protein [Prevotella sp.]
MKNIKVVLLVLCSILFLNSCSSDDDNPVIPAESIKLEGKWIIKEINFKSNVKAWKSETFTDVMDVFGWAPYMFESASGVEFTKEDYTDSQTQKSGKIFKLVTGSSYGGSGKVYWVWNQTEDGKAFEVIQFNSQMPPYDFSMSKTSSLEETTLDGKRVLIFTTTLVSIDQDRMDESSNPMTRPKVAATATFTLVETSGEIDTEVSPSLKLNGAEFKLPEQADPTVVTKENLVGTSWMLKSGSKIFDPGMVTSPVGDKYEFTKLVTFNFFKADSLEIRYSYPLGIVTTKKVAWAYDNENNIFSFEKAGSAGFGIPPQKYLWKATYSTDDDVKYLVLDVHEIISYPGEASEAKVDLSAVDTGLFKREFASVSADDVKDTSTAVKKDNYTIFK